MRKIAYVLIYIIFLSCSEENHRELKITPCASAPGEKYEILNEKQGTLVYTNNIGPVRMNEFRYVINIPGYLPLEVCNMPKSIQFNQYENRGISFSGKVTVLPEEVDAFSTRLELIKIIL